MDTLTIIRLVLHLGDHGQHIDLWTKTVLRKFSHGR